MFSNYEGFNMLYFLQVLAQLSGSSPDHITRFLAFQFIEIIIKEILSDNDILQFTLLKIIIELTPFDNVTSSSWSLLKDLIMSKLVSTFISRSHLKNRITYKQHIVYRRLDRLLRMKNLILRRSSHHFSYKRLIHCTLLVVLLSHSSKLLMIFLTKYNHATEKSPSCIILLVEMRKIWQVLLFEIFCALLTLFNRLRFVMKNLLTRSKPFLLTHCVCMLIIYWPTARYHRT